MVEVVGEEGSLEGVEDDEVGDDVAEVEDTCASNDDGDDDEACNRSRRARSG